MTWVRKDDRMPWHRKVAPLSDAAYRLLDEAICWASANLTDGRIGQAELADISKRGKPKYAAELVARGLWHTADVVCGSEQCPPPGPDGWVIHDYWDYQPSKAKILGDRQANRERQRRWAEARKGNGRSNASPNASPNASQDALLTEPRPVPSRPVTSGTGPYSAQGRTARDPEPPPTDDRPSAVEQIMTEYRENSPRGVSRTVAAKLAEHVHELLGDGFQPDHIREALGQLRPRRLGPGALPSLVDEIANRPPDALPSNGHAARASPHRPSTTDARVAAALAAGEAVQAMLDRGEITDGRP